MSEKNQRKSNGRGGVRKGAGRKAGSATKKTRAIADKAAEEGVTPLEVMLRTMRQLVTDAEGEDPTKPNTMLLERAAAVAKDAAPYMHARLSSVDVKATVTNHEAALAELS